ncbi:hypothetical protein [Streptomyces sp. NPDC005303]|uniref:hypothetical protein n=1 Tax=Streptomyces sp. NPDC005303 TaxID=3155713 RepID=UPI0033BE1A34
MCGQETALLRRKPAVLALRDEDLIGTGQVTMQSSLDHVRDRFGPGVIGPAAV